MTSAFSSQLTRLYASASEAVLGVVEEIDADSFLIEATSGSAQKASARFHEKLGFGFVLTNPRNRMFMATNRRLDLSVAVARFVWMMSGSNRLADIAFYEPKVAGFTDDGFSVPGSSYGQRIFQSSPGIDQLRAIISRINEDPNTRRATVSIYQPTDATRESKDIPCTFGLMYHPRNGKLNATTIMRSNNAIGLLQFNIFEFSMLAEVVAAEADLPIGEMLHFAGSMHAFQNHLESWGEGGKPKPIPTSVMEQMPSTPKPLAQITELIIFEAEMRHASASLRAAQAQTWIERAQRSFDPYWQQFAFILLLAVAHKNGDAESWDVLRSLLRSAYTPFFPESKRPAGAGVKVDASSITGDLFSFEEPPTITPIYSPAAKAKVLSLAQAYQERSGSTLRIEEFSAVQDVLLNRIAARGLDFESSISESDFDDALENARDAIRNGDS